MKLCPIFGDFQRVIFGVTRLNLGTSSKVLRLKIPKLSSAGEALHLIKKEGATAHRLMLHYIFSIPVIFYIIFSPRDLVEIPVVLVKNACPAALSKFSSHVSNTLTFLVSQSFPICLMEVISIESNSEVRLIPYFNSNDLLLALCS